MKLNIEDEEKREDYKGESKQRPYNAFDERKRRPVREGRGGHLASLSSYVDVERCLRCCFVPFFNYPLCSTASLPMMKMVSGIAISCRRSYQLPQAAFAPRSSREDMMTASTLSEAVDGEGLAGR